MPRANKNPPKTRAEREAHEERLARRRARRHDKRTVKMAEQAAEGQSDFAALVAAERARMGEDTPGPKNQAEAGKKSPKSITTARDNLTRAFDLMGGVPALVVWGRSNPTEFYRLWARLIPKEAADEAVKLPLETLLEKLASKEEKSVGTAAWEIGAELLEQGKAQAAAEDALHIEQPPTDSIN